MISVLIRTTEMGVLGVLAASLLWLLLPSVRKGRSGVPGGTLSWLLLCMHLAGCNTTPDPALGKQWHIQNANVSPQMLTSCAWSGSLWVAVGDPGLILTSPDGHTWTRQTSPRDQSLFGIAWSGSLWSRWSW